MLNPFVYQVHLQKSRIQQVCGVRKPCARVCQACCTNFTSLRLPPYPIPLLSQFLESVSCIEYSTGIQVCLYFSLWPH